MNFIKQILNFIKQILNFTKQTLNFGKKNSNLQKIYLMLLWNNVQYSAHSLDFVLKVINGTSTHVAVHVFNFVVQALKSDVQSLK